MGYRIVVAGATGNVGREVLAILAEREFPIDELAAVASSRSQGTDVEIGDSGRTVKCQNIDNFDWTGWDMAIFAIGSDATAIHAPKAAAAGCVVIDNSSLYRMDPDVPLIVPEVNPDAIDGYTKRNIIANPNCSTAQMVVALKPLHDAQDQARRRLDLSIGVGRGQVGHGRAVEPDAPDLRRRREGRAEVHQADRLQRHPAHRQIPRRRIDQGGMEDGRRDKEDPRSED